MPASKNLATGSITKKFKRMKDPFALKNSRTLLGITWGISALLLFTPLKLLTLPIILLFLSRYFPIPGKSASLLLRTIFLFLVFTCLQQVVGILFWVVHIDFTWNWSIVPLLLLALFCLIRPPSFTSEFKLFTRDDIAAAVVSILSVLVIAGTTLSGGPIGQQLLRYLTTGFDNTAHFSLSVSVYEEQGYIYGPIESTEERLVYKNLSAYPQGWHLSNSTIWHALTNDVNIMQSPRKAFVLFFATILLWYGITIFLVARLILGVSTIIRKRRKSTTISHVTIFSLTVLLQMLLLFSVIKYGFSNYLALICYLLATIYCGLHAQDKQELMGRNSFLIIGLLLCAGATYTWLLAAPIGFLFVLLVFISSFKRPLKEIPVWILRNTLICLAAISLVAASFVQGFLQVKYSVIPGNINADGGMWTINYLLFFMLLMGSLAFVAHSGTVNKGLSKTILSMIISFGTVAGYINFYQFYTAGHSSYYSSKIGALMFIVLFIFGAAIIVVAAEKLAFIYGKLLIACISLSLILIVPLAIGADMPDLRFANGADRKLSPYSSSQLTSLMYEKKIYSNNIFVLKELDYEEDVISSHFMNMLSRKAPACVQHFTWHQISQQRESAVEDIITCAKTNPNLQYYVIVSSKNADELSRRFSVGNNITTMLSN